jgi:WD40 repeat protein
MDGTGITLPNNVQGGAFSPNGHLYISVGSLDGMYGIWAFDTDGTLYGRYWGQHSPTFRYPFTYADDEVEGMDIVDMSTHPGAGMNGQIHMVKMKQHGWTHNDGLVFYHWNINSPYY